MESILHQQLALDVLTLSQPEYAAPMPDRVTLEERFEAKQLDRSVWFPHYLPHWSSRARSAAEYRLESDGLHLSIPATHPLWCADLHEEPLRVSCLQTGTYSGPVGSGVGQMPFRTGLVVTEEQRVFRGFTPTFGDIEIGMRGVVSDRSMFAFWMSGFEDSPERSGEICVAEIFGDALTPGGAKVGVGIHRFRDPSLVEDFETVGLPIDISEFHTYGVRWRPDSVTFLVDGAEIRISGQSPRYPMQLMMGVFDFPARATPDDDAVPEMVVSHVVATESS